MNGEGITVLAPTNGAIATLPTWKDIEADPAALQHFVLAHVVAGQFDEQELFAAAQVTSLSGDVLQIDPARRRSTAPISSSSINSAPTASPTPSTPSSSCPR